MTKQTDRQIIENVLRALIAAGIIPQEDFTNGAIRRVN